MINEVCEVLRALVREDVLDGSDVEVVFDAPTRDWAASRNAPTVSLYLYDIHENPERRQRGLVNEYDQRGSIVGRVQPPRYFDLSYLLTAWTQRPEDEHRLLSAALTCLLRHPVLPTDQLPDPLAALGLPVPVTVALPPTPDRSLADVWSALGGELKPSLDVVVSAPVDAARRLPAGPPVQEPLILRPEDDVSERWRLLGSAKASS